LNVGGKIVKAFRTLAVLALAVLLAGCVVVLQAPGTLEVDNNDLYSLIGLYESDAGTGLWSANLIAGTSILSGGSALVTLDPGSYDLEAVAADGFVFRQYDVSISSGVTTIWTVP
jgi:hypothetical protein